MYNAGGQACSTATERLSCDSQPHQQLAEATKQLPMIQIPDCSPVDQKEPRTSNRPHIRQLQKFSRMRSAQYTAEKVIRNNGKI
jgi:hypothetical protein